MYLARDARAYPDTSSGTTALTMSFLSQTISSSPHAVDHRPWFTRRECNDESAIGRGGSGGGARGAGLPAGGGAECDDQRNRQERGEEALHGLLHSWTGCADGLDNDARVAGSERQLLDDRSAGGELHRRAPGQERQGGLLGRAVRH